MNRHNETAHNLKKLINMFFKILNNFLMHYDVEYSNKSFKSLSGNKYPLILDMGCGDGKKALAFRNACSEIVGLDVSTEDVRKAKKRGIETILGDAHFLPFKNYSFDAITCFHTIEHLRNYVQAIGEIYRVLKMKGFLLLVTPNRVRITSALASALYAHIQKCYSDIKYPTNPNHVFEFEDKHLEYLFERSHFIKYRIIPLFIGFKVASLYCEIRLPKILERYCDQWMVLAIK